MAIKLIMRWDVQPETESEYYEFLVHEFIPGMNKLGVADIQVCIHNTENANKNWPVASPNHLKLCAKP
jgi:hypothetical protein